MTAPQIRHAVADDLPRINEIYNSYIVGRNTSFDIEPWTIEQRTDWFAKYSVDGRYQALVMAIDDEIAGFASSSPFREKLAYRTSVETTVVIDAAYTGRGLGGPLLEALLGRLHGLDIHRAYALIALPNEPSVALHARCGYREVGVLDEVGHKLNSYHSVLIMELRL